MGAAADCELIGEGLFGQPVNSLTTAAFAVAGVIVLRRPALRWVGIGLIATGLGSFLFHGPMPAGAEWAHDVTVAWLILLVTGVGRRWELVTRLPGLVFLGVFFFLLPAAADPVAVLLAIAAGVLLLRDDRSRGTVGPIVLLVATGTLGRLGATGWPLCDPDSVLQTHGLWHIAAAAAVAWWATARDPAFSSE